MTIKDYIDLPQVKSFDEYKHYNIGSDYEVCDYDDLLEKVYCEVEGELIGEIEDEPVEYLFDLILEMQIKPCREIKFPCLDEIVFSNVYENCEAFDDIPEPAKSVIKQCDDKLKEIKTGAFDILEKRLSDEMINKIIEELKK